MTELLLQTPLEGRQREYGQAIQSSSGALMAVIGDILDFSKMEAGRLEIDRADFKLKELVESACAAIRVQARMKGVELTLTLDAALPAAVCGDVVRVRQILLNLLSNALKFTSAGEIAVRVGFSPQHEREDMVRFEVADSGIGIEPSEVGRLFESFTQAETSTTRSYGGTGLGLAISKQLVGLMDGEIGAQSAVGEGSRFWFAIPLPAAPAATAAAEQPPPPSHSTPAEQRELPPRPFAATFPVLVVEDNEINRIVASQMLNKLGYADQTAGDGHEAVELCATGSFALILMDCQMPRLDGYEATREIRRREAGGRRTPIVAMTAGAMAGERDKCMGAGMDDFLTKPLRLEALREVLEQALARRPPAVRPGNATVPAPIGS